MPNPMLSAGADPDAYADSMRLVAASGVLAAAVLALACDPVTRPPTATNPVCTPGELSCDGNVVQRCSESGAAYVREIDCSVKQQVCVRPQGCLGCVPGSPICDGLSIRVCRADGSGYDLKQKCDGDNGETCEGGRCQNACKLAEESRSYVGCEYFAVDLDNAYIDDTLNAQVQQFAVVVSNPSLLPAQVTVERNTAERGQPPAIQIVRSFRLPSMDLEIVNLPMREVDGSKTGKNEGSNTALSSAAYRIRSTAPIIAYQFNPLENVNVFSNDASLLVPTSALRDNRHTYMVMGWPQTVAKTPSNPNTNMGTDLRAFITIVGTEADTEVLIETKARIVGGGPVPESKPGGPMLSLRLGAFDVANLESGDFNADFTGSFIQATKPVVVFSGSEASDVPAFPDLTKRQCCADHLEEQLFPLSTLGKTFVAANTQSRSAALEAAGAKITALDEPEYFRILATAESTHVTTNLPPPYDQFDLAGGEFVTFPSERDFIVQASAAVVFAQFMTSQNALGIPQSLPGGDPSFILVPPVEQWRRRYVFLVPNKYSFDSLAIAAPSTAKIQLDGGDLPDDCEYANAGQMMLSHELTSFQGIRCPLSHPRVLRDGVPPHNVEPGQQGDGVHILESSEPVGLVVSGFDNYVSYGYPAGTNLDLINLE